MTYVVGPEPLDSFWSGMPDNDPRTIGHPAFRNRGYENRLIPLRIHGDKVPIGKGHARSLDVVSISSCTGSSGPTWDT
eukprot:10018829-Lingulodinium_polyedra.AAC.1